MSSACITPFYKKEAPLVPLPCGKCPGCVKRKTSGWSFRLRKESELHTHAEFVTLTYENPPLTRRNLMTLDKRDCQLFFKRLRKLTNKRIKEHFEKITKTPKAKINVNTTIRYYLAGEYGTRYGRPHYHIILFGAEQQDVVQAWTNPETKKPIGHVHFGYDTSEKAVGYTLKYISKESRIPVHRNDDRLPEFSLMSKKLGSNYLTEEIKKWHLQDLDNRYYMPLKDGKKASLPRYYKEKIYSSEQSGHLKGVMEKETIKAEKKAREKYGDKYDDLKAQSDKQAFDKMYYREKQNRTL